MQGLNPITMQCTYATPCGWCAKWDKKCDKKIGCGNPSLESMINWDALSPEEQRDCMALIRARDKMINKEK